MTKIALCLLVATSLLYADASSTITVNESDLPADVLAKVKAKQAVGAAIGDDGAKYIEMGKAVGLATDGALSAITKNANDLANTKVGVFLMWIVAWKVIGYPVVQFIVGVPLMLVGWLGLIGFYRTQHLPRSVLMKVNADKSKEYSMVDNCYRRWDGEVMCGYCGAAVIWTAVCCLVIFVH